MGSVGPGVSEARSCPAMAGTINSVDETAVTDTKITFLIPVALVMAAFLFQQTHGQFELSVDIRLFHAGFVVSLFVILFTMRNVDDCNPLFSE